MDVLTKQKQKQKWRKYGIKDLTLKIAFSRYCCTQLHPQFSLKICLRFVSNSFHIFSKWKILWFQKGLRLKVFSCSLDTVFAKTLVGNLTNSSRRKCFCCCFCLWFMCIYGERKLKNKWLGNIYSRCQFHQCFTSTQAAYDEYYFSPQKNTIIKCK